MENFLVSLNEAQKAAVTSPAPVLQVLAGPGSGKTRVLTSRVAYLIAHNGLAPKDIIVCTFTVKAAREMKERICGFLGDEVASQLILGTFHSICRRFLACYGKLIGLNEKFGIADSSDSASIVARIIKRNQCTLDPSKARSRISRLKSKAIGPRKLSESNKKAEEQEFNVLYGEYEEHLKASSLLDFDDLLLKCVDLLRDFPQCVSNIKAVLIDEFQDTNNVQYDLMELYAQRNECITIVGDPDQSIYGWRSAEIGNLLRMQERFPDIHVAKLEENHRSSGSILAAAQELIEQDSSRPSKQLTPVHSVGLQPVLRKLPTAWDEAEWVVSEITRISAFGAGLFEWDDFAVLLRSASLSRVLEVKLNNAGIPYRMVGGHRFYDRHEIKVVLDYLRVINHPDHNDAIARILNIPSRKIGAATIEKLTNEAEVQGVSLWKHILNIIRGRTKPPEKMLKKALKGLECFARLILDCQRRLVARHSQWSSLDKYLEDLLKKVGMKKYLDDIKPDDSDARWANIEELLAQAREVSFLDVSAGLDDDVEGNDLHAMEMKQERTLEEAVTQFLANTALANEVKTEQEDPASTKMVTLSTIHSAKGLEFPVVFIPGIYEGSIPHSRAEDTDEERRLLFVAMTRAQSLLYLSVPSMDSRKDTTTPSTFLSEHPMDSMFRKCGEKFGFETIKEIACILKRPCISRVAFECAVDKIQNPYDDQWSLTGLSGEEQPEYVYCSDEDGQTWHDRLSFKRRKMNLAEDTTRLGAHRQNSRFRAPTSMEARSNFTVFNSSLPPTITTASTVLSRTTIVDGVLNETGPQASARAPWSKLSHTTSQKGHNTIPSPEKRFSDQKNLNFYFNKLDDDRPRASSNQICLASQAPRGVLTDKSNAMLTVSTIKVEPKTADRTSTNSTTQSVNFHKSSLQRLDHSFSKPQRKTLGLKRSMDGWAARMAKNRAPQ